MAAMFSYRHAFHAGNHADVLKHIALVAVLRHLMQKPAPLTLIDTHAGAGSYPLGGRQAQTSGEANQGVAALLTHLHAGQDSTSNRPEALVQASQTAIDSIAPALHDYLQALAAFNGDGRLRSYPGSPLLLLHALRAEAPDRLRLFELHPTDGRLLAGLMRERAAGRDVAVLRQDGFEGLKALLPPPPSGAGKSRRALVLIDPSYELKTDYARVAGTLQWALERFATGCYLVWYPVIARPEAHQLPRRLKTLATQAQRPWLHATMDIGVAPDAVRGTPAGLQASGVFVINPPHTLAAALRPALTQVLAALGRGRGAAQKIETGGPA